VSDDADASQPDPAPQPRGKAARRPKVLPEVYDPDDPNAPVAPPPNLHPGATARDLALRDHPARERSDINRLGPVPKGWLRGRIRGIDAVIEQAEYGETTTHTFVIHPPKPDLPFTVVMRGLTISRRINEGEMVQVRCADPSVQPIITDRMYLPMARAWVRTFNAYGVSAERRRREVLYGWLMVIGPMILICGTAFLLWRFTDIFTTMRKL
jgi:hypothetical protein